MTHEMQISISFTILMLPVITHLAILIGCSVWGFVDDSGNKYARWLYKKITGRSIDKFGEEECLIFLSNNIIILIVYISVVIGLSYIHHLAPYMLAGFIVMMMLGRSLRRLQKIVTEHVSDKKIHKGGK